MKMNDSWDDLDIDTKDDYSRINKYIRSNSPRNISSHFFSEQAALSCDINDPYKRSVTPATEKVSHNLEGQNSLKETNNDETESKKLLEKANLPVPNIDSSQPQFLGSSYGSQDRTKRVFGQNFKYMKHYVRERRNSLSKPEIPSENPANRDTTAKESVMRRRNSEGSPVMLQQPAQPSESNLHRQYSYDFLNDSRNKTFQRQNSHETNTLSSLKQKSLLRFETNMNNRLSNSRRENEENISAKDDQKINPPKYSPVRPSLKSDNMQRVDLEKTSHIDENNNANISQNFQDFTDSSFRPNFVRQLLSHGNDKNLRLDTVMNADQIVGHGFVKISKHKLQKMQETNDMALKRKDELQRELLDALKKISQLEVSQTHSYTEKRELLVELRIAKERLADAEREAANSIGRASKLEQDLNESNSNCNRYLEELKKSQDKLTSLEDDFCQTKANYLFECTKKEDEENRVQKLEQQLDNAKEEILKLKSFLSVKEKEFEDACNEIESLHREKNIEEREKRSILHDKENLEENHNKVLHKSKNNEKTIEQLQSNLKDQKIKFDIIIKSRINLENELNKMHEELSKEKVEKQQILIDFKKVDDENGQFKSVLLELKERNDELKYENQELKNKVTEIGLYHEMLEESRQRHKPLFMKKKEMRETQREDATDSKRSYIIPGKVNRRSFQNNNNIETMNYRKKYPSVLKSSMNDEMADGGNETDKNELSSNKISSQENMLRNGENILKSSRNNKMQWDRSAFDIQKNSYLFDESLEAEDYGEDGYEPEEIERQESSNYTQRKPIGVTFAPDVETFDESENNFSDMLHKSNQDLVDAFMQ